jgi:hypothetical protein
VRGSAAEVARAVSDDLRAAGNIAELTFVDAPDDELATEVVLAEPVAS